MYYTPRTHNLVFTFHSFHLSFFFLSFLSCLHATTSPPPPTRFVSSQRHLNYLKQQNVSLDAFHIPKGIFPSTCNQNWAHVVKKSPAQLYMDFATPLIRYSIGLVFEITHGMVLYYIAWNTHLAIQIVKQADKPIANHTKNKQANNKRRSQHYTTRKAMTYSPPTPCPRP